MLKIQAYGKVKPGNVVLVRSALAESEIMTNQPIVRLNDEKLDLKLDQATGLVAVRKESCSTEGRAYLNNGYQVVILMDPLAYVIDTERESFEPVLNLTKADSPGIYHRIVGEKAQEPQGTPFFAESMPLKVGDRLRCPSGQEVIIASVSERVGPHLGASRVIRGFLGSNHCGADSDLSEANRRAVPSESDLSASPKETAVDKARLVASAAALPADPTESSQFKPTLSRPNVLEFRRLISGLPCTFDLPRALSLAAKGFAITGKSWSQGSYFLLEYGKIIMYNSIMPVRFVLAADESLEQETWSIFGLDMDRAAISLGELKEGDL